MPTTDEFREALRRKLADAEASGAPSLVVKAVDFHREVGKSPREKYDHFPGCSRAMHEEFKSEIDEMIHSPEKLHGPSLTIRYSFPRDKNRRISDEAWAAITISAFEEGQRRLKEFQTIYRNQALVKAAKAALGSRCAACGFNFGVTYGDHGEGYIECHHIDPLSGRGGSNTPTTIQDVIMLCANCHRMIHYRRPDALTLEELKALLAPSPAFAARP